MSDKTPTAKCPRCGEPAAQDATNDARPFCSARCRGADLLGWLNEEHAITDRDGEW